MLRDVASCPFTWPALLDNTRQLALFDTGASFIKFVAIIYDSAAPNYRAEFQLRKITLSAARDGVIKNEMGFFPTPFISSRIHS